MSFSIQKFLKSILIREENTATPKEIEIVPGGSAGTKTTLSGSQTTNVSLTLPDATDTLVGKATTDTLTNKTFDADGTGNVLSNIDDGNIKAAAAIDASKIADGSVSNTEFQFINSVTSNVQTQLNGKVNDTGDTMTGDLNMSGTQRITNMADPSSAQDAATKAYVDSVAAGLDPKEAVRVATTANLAFTYNTSPSNGQFTSVGGALSIDGVSLATGNRVLVKDQTDAKQNGIYTYDSSAQTLTRSSDMDGSPASEVSAGNFTFTTQGTANAANGYVVTGNGTLTLNTDNISWTSFSGGASGASRDLSNLLPTSINESLVPATDVAIALGSATKRYTSAHTQEVRNTGADLTLTSTTGKLVVSATSVDLPAASSDPGTPGESDLYYNTGLDKFKAYDGSRWRQLATKDEDNYILNGYAESSTTGWATYADAASATPVDGTGGSPNVTFTTSATAPLQGQNSFIFTKDAANRQGQGASYDFTIDNAAKSKLMQVSFDFLVDSGTFTASNGTSDSDVTVWLFDVTNSRLIQPTSYRLLSNSSSVSFGFIGNFQTTDSTSYRLILHVATTSAVAYALKLDNINVSRAGMTLGTDSTITDWKNAGTITVTGTTSNPTKGTTTVDKFWYRRVGDTLQCRIEYNHSTGGSAGSGDYLINLPSGLGVTIDTTKVEPYATLEGTGGWQAKSAVGSGHVADNSTVAGGTLVVYDATRLRFMGYDSGTTGVWNSGFYSFAAANSSFNFFFEVPILGWSSQTLTADISTKPTVAAKYTFTSSRTYSSTQPLNADIKVYDTHNAVTTGSNWKFTAPISGIYKIEFSTYSNNGAVFKNVLYKNGVADTFLSYSNTGIVSFVGGTTSVQLNAGDYIDIRAIDATATTAVVGENFFISVERLSDITSVTTINNLYDTSNYITNGTAEYGTLNWSTYADAAASMPVDGTGGSPNVTINTTTSSPLTGINSFLLAKDAANRQGQGFSYAFTTDAAAQGKMMQVSFDYLVDSGTFSTGTASTDSDITVWAYDVTNSQLLPVVLSKLTSSSTTIPSRFISNFQSSSGSTSYRLIFHVATTSASAFTLKIDNVSVKKVDTLIGTTSTTTDWLSYTPTLGSGFGTTSNVSFLYRRNGPDLLVKGSFTAGTVSANPATISLPAGLSLDSSKISINNTSSNPGEMVGNYENSEAAANTRGVMVTAPSTSSSLIYFGSSETNASSALTPANGNTVTASSVVVSLEFKIPIVGWTSDTITADVTTKPMVAASYFCSTNFAASTTIPINYDSKEYDTHNAVTTSATAWKFTAPIAGTYQISGSGSSATGGQFCVLYKNGTAYKGCGSVASGGANSSGVFTADVQLNAGDYVDIRPISANTVTGNTLGATTSSPASNINIIRLSDVNTVVMVGGGKKLGYDHTTATNVTFGVNDFHGVRVFPSSDAVVTRLAIFLGSNAAGKKYTLGIYDQTSGGLPGNKLAQTTEQTTAVPTGATVDAGYKFVDLTTSVFVKKNTPYWLCVHSDSSFTVENAFNIAASGGQKYRNLAYNATLPTSFGTPTGDAGAGISMGGF